MVSLAGLVALPVAALPAAALPVAALPVAALPAAAASGASAASASTAGPRVGWITGVVVDASGDPVAGDLVNALGPREVPEAGIVASDTDRRGVTAADGSFRVRQASPHGFLVQVCNPEPSDPTTCRETAQGVDHLITYAGPSGVTDSWVTQTSLFPTTGGDRDLGSITVRPQSYVHGTIAGADRRSIQLQRTNGTVAYYGSTDEQGWYRFQGLAPGHYRVAAGGDGFRPWRSPVFELPTAADREVDGTLDRGAGIHGVVTSEGRPVPFLDILVRRAGGRLVAATTTGPHGFYRVTGLLPGHFRVGVTYDGSDYRRHAVRVTLTDRHQRAAAPITLAKGAVVTLALRMDGRPAIRATDELRNGNGRPILGHRNLDGRVTYPGLAPGRYTVVAADDTRFTTATVRVTTARTYDLGTKVLDRPTLTLTGTTAPRAVVEAMTGDQCPPDGPDRLGFFHEIERADASGHYVVHGLVPGTYMLGSDGYPANVVPSCRSDVPIRHDRRAALALAPGSKVSGRLVYAATGSPVITTLSYQLTYPPGSPHNPTDEHPSRARSAGASGLFTVDRLAAATVTGQLSQGADVDQVTSPRFFVVFPFQDGTPYYLASRKRTIEVPAGGQVRLGGIPLYLHR